MSLLKIEVITSSYFQEKSKIPLGPVHVEVGEPKVGEVVEVVEVPHLSCESSQEKGEIVWRDW